MLRWEEQRAAWRRICVETGLCLDGLAESDEED